MEIIIGSYQKEIERVKLQQIKQDHLEEHCQQEITVPNMKESLTSQKGKSRIQQSQEKQSPLGMEGKQKLRKMA